MIDEILASAQEHFDKAISAFQRDCAKLRTGRANPALLEGIRVEYYGQTVPLNQVASVTVTDARLLTIKPWEKPMVAVIEKAILASDLGLTPNNRGELILVPIPALTGERRRQLSKVVRKDAEKAKVSLRNGRRDALDMVEMLDDISEDEVHRTKKKVQDLLDVASKRVDGVMADKEKEILEGP